MEKLIGALKIMLDGYTSDRFDRLMLAYNRFINTMKQEPVIEQLLPLAGERLGAPETVWDYLYEPRRAGARPGDVALHRGDHLPGGGREHGLRAVGAHGRDEGRLRQRRRPDRRAHPRLTTRTGRRASPRNSRKSSAALLPFRPRKPIHGTSTRHHRPVHRRGDRHRVFRREGMPNIYDALVLEETGEEGLAEKGLTFEVEQQLGDGVVRCIALGSSDGLAPRHEGEEHRRADLGSSRQGTLGRIMDVLGADRRGGPINTEERRSIHQAAPKFAELSPSVELLETGIKVIDLICPFAKGGKIGLFGGAGVGKTVNMPSSSTTSRRSTPACRCSRAWANAPRGQRLLPRDDRGGGHQARQHLGVQGGDVFGQMNEPPGNRLRVGLTGLTMAEYFRDEGRGYLFFVDNIYRFTLAGVEVSAACSGSMPSAVGYQPTLAEEMGKLQERITSTKVGSITSVQAIYVPATT